MIESWMVVTSSVNTSKNDVRIRNTARYSASLTQIWPVVIGLFLVLAIRLSIFLSAISLRVQPADRINTTPEIKISRTQVSGMPLAAIHNAHKVGHKSKYIPIGLFNLVRLI